MTKYIAVIGTLDTKEQEIEYVRDLIVNKGHTPIVIDCGLMREPTIIPDISRHDVASASETTIGGLLALGDKNNAISTMARGVTSVTSQLYAKGKLNGVIALGGVQGTTIGTAAMRALPVGVPKVMVSAVANGQTTFGPFVDTKDIAIIHSVADILGLNIITRQVLAEGVGAVIGMAEMKTNSRSGERPTVAITAAGVTTPCAMHARKLFEEWGYEVIAFHCNGIGSKAMEELADEGRLQGILDLSPHDIGGLLRGGLMQASPDRLEAVCRQGVPIVFVPGGIDFILYGPLYSIAPEKLKRNYVEHNAIHTHVRADKGEMKEAGRFVAERLNKTNGLATVMIPTKGFSQLNIDGGALFDPAADRGFIEGVNEVASEKLELIQLDWHINDQAFAETISKKLRVMIET